MYPSPPSSSTLFPSNCHPERSEGSSCCLPREMLHFEMLHCVQHDSDEQTVYATHPLTRAPFASNNGSSLTTASRLRPKYSISTRLPGVASATGKYP